MCFAPALYPESALYTRCHQRASNSMLLFQPNNRLGHPENVFFIIYKCFFCIIQNILPFILKTKALVKINGSLFQRRICWFERPIWMYRRTATFWIVWGEKTSVYRGTLHTRRSVLGPNGILIEQLRFCRHYLSSLVFVDLLESENCEIEIQIVAIPCWRNSIFLGPMVVTRMSGKMFAGNFTKTWQLSLPFPGIRKVYYCAITWVRFHVK